MIDNGMLRDRAKAVLASCQPSATLPTLLYMIAILLLEYLSNRITSIMLLDIVPSTSWEEILSSWPYAAAQLVPDFGGVSGKTFIAWLLSIAIAVFAQVFNVGYYSYCLKLSRGVQTKLGDLLDGFNHFTKIIGLYIVSAIFIYLWSLLFVVPGIVASYRYRQAYYILIENPDISVLEALRRSKAMMRGHKLELFFLDLSFIGWYILCVMTVNILFIWKMPYFEVTYANFYNLVSGRDWWSDDGGRSWRV